MARFIKDRTQSKGQAPGSLIFIGKQKMDRSVIQLTEYNAETLVEKELSSIDETEQCINFPGVSWINIYGIHDLDMIKRMGEIFNINHLLLEDLLNTDQRPKYEDGETYDAFILKMLKHDDKEEKIKAEQITLILGKNYVITLQEQRGDVFDPVRERIRFKKRRVRLNDNDYLAYALLDTIVDNYMILIEKIGAKVEDMEDKVFLKTDSRVAEDLYKFKTELNFLRKSVRPLLDIMAYLLKSEDTMFHEKNFQYLRDMSDLVTQLTDAIELYNSIVSDQLNIYHTNVSNRMNEVMKVLTIFASIFIPLTFLAGIYGMNFEYIPELKFRYSYPIFWGVSLIIGIGLVFYFKKKRWL